MMIDVPIFYIHFYIMQTRSQTRKLNRHQNWVRFNTIFNDNMKIKQFESIRLHIDQLFIDTPNLTFAQLINKYPIEDTPSHCYNFMQMAARVVNYHNHNNNPYEHQKNLDMINFYNQLTQCATDTFWEEIDAIIHHESTHRSLTLVTQLYSHIETALAHRVYHIYLTEESRQFYLKSIERWDNDKQNKQTLIDAILK